ncbi:MAG: hypothetical protein JJ900_09560 [Rhodospirillales bacterium]|nr:hypothetical protein [Rhodospirillales bacterium]MBO6787085.1 hypothetical protein [Rhodospirillales bacterium]
MAADTDKTATFDPIAAYGPQISFDVYRKDELIGRHTVHFRRENGDLIAASRFQIQITVLGLPLYTYDYTSLGRWRDGTLQTLRARTDDDGTVSEVSAERHGGEMKIIADDVQSVVPGEVFPTTHWNPAVIGTAQVLNTITGRINTVNMTEAGTEDIATGNGSRPARRFVYSGDLETDVWYDMAGRWVKMKFDGNDGVPIEYRCIVCGSERPLNTETDAHAPEGTL